MPITPNYEWNESDAAITVVANIPGLSRQHTDVTATDCMIKINCSPYLLLLDLYGEVDDSRSIATLAPGVVTFTLVKKVPGLWGTLTAVGDRHMLTRRRNASVDRAHARLEAQRLERVEHRKQEEKAATDRQIDTERKKRQYIEQRKAEELSAERDKLQGWQRALDTSGPGDANRPPHFSRANDSNESDYESDGEEDDKPQGVRAAVPEEAVAPDHPSYYGRGFQRQDRPRAGVEGHTESSPAFAHGSGGSTGLDRCPGSSEEEEEEEEAASRWERAMREVAPPGGWGAFQEDQTVPAPASVDPADQGTAAVSFVPLPPPRVRLQPVPVTFTSLETGYLPARQVREAEIKEYKRKEQDRRLVADSADVADRQPVFLKDKGDALFAQANYRGALNAYSRALELDPALPAVWSNRAACHLKLGEPELCVDDASGALHMLKARRAKLEAAEMEEADAAPLRKMLVRALVRRGQALGRLGRYLEAAADYEQALRWDRGNAQLENDLQELLSAAQPADAAALRQRGDARFRSGDSLGAVEAYTALLGLSTADVAEPERLAALSNRAACCIVLERFGQAVADCNAALQLAVAHLPGWAVDAAATGAGRAAAHGVPEAEALRAWAQSWGQELARPPPGVEGARLTCVGRLLSRRGAAKTYLKQPAAAATDLSAAAALLQLAGGASAQVVQLLADSSRLRATCADGGMGSPASRPGQDGPAPVDEAAPSDDGPEAENGRRGSGGTSSASAPGAPGDRGTDTRAAVGDVEGGDIGGLGHCGVGAACAEAAGRSVLLPQIS